MQILSLNLHIIVILFSSKRHETDTFDRYTARHFSNRLATLKLILSPLNLSYNAKPLPFYFSDFSLKLDGNL